MSKKLGRLGEVNLSIYESLDYRDFLKRRILESKTLSLDSVARKSGCVSKSYLSLIINKKRDLGNEKAVAVGQAVGLKGRELKFFESLVRFNRSKNETSKIHYLRELSNLRPNKNQSPPVFNEVELLKNWHALAIREFVSLPKFKNDPQFISMAFKGMMTPTEAKEALHLLLATGLLVIKHETLVHQNAAIQSTDDIRSAAIQSYHKSCLKLGSSALETQPTAEREYGSLNLAISADGFEQIKAKLKALRAEVLQLALSDQSPDRVCQFNFQFFHLTRRGL